MSIRKGHLKTLDFSQGTTKPTKSLSLVDLINSPRSQLKPKNYQLTISTKQSTNENSLK